jgi:hypothetical protein
MYVIKRTDQGGGYLQPSGSHKAFGKLEGARTFPTKAAAEAECCKGNEIAVPLADCMD